MCNGKFQCGYCKLDILEAENEKLKFIAIKWNCECCRLSYARGGCPDHGPCLA